MVPLFPGYCFARFRDADRLRVLKAFGVVDLVGMNGQHRQSEIRYPTSTPWPDAHHYRTCGQRTLRPLLALTRAPS